MQLLLCLEGFLFECKSIANCTKTWPSYARFRPCQDTKASPLCTLAGLRLITGIAQSTLSTSILPHLPADCFSFVSALFSEFVSWSAMVPLLPAKYSLVYCYTIHCPDFPGLDVNCKQELILVLKVSRIRLEVIIWWENTEGCDSHRRCVGHEI